MFSTDLHHITTNTQTQPENFQETLLISSRFPGGKNYFSRFPGFPGVLDTLLVCQCDVIFTWICDTTVVKCCAHGSGPQLQQQGYHHRHYVAAGQQYLADTQ